MTAREPRTVTYFHPWWLYLLSGAATVVVEELYVVGSWNNSPFTVGHWLRTAIADENGTMHPAALSIVIDWIATAVFGLIAARACRALVIRTGFARHALATDRVTSLLGLLVEAAWCAVLPVALFWVSVVSSGFVP